MLKLGRCQHIFNLCFPGFSPLFQVPPVLQVKPHEHHTSGDECRAPKACEYDDQAHDTTSPRIAGGLRPCVHVISRETAYRADAAFGTAVNSGVTMSCSPGLLDRAGCAAPLFNDLPSTPSHRALIADNQPRFRKHR